MERPSVFLSVARNTPPPRESTPPPAANPHAIPLRTSFALSGLATITGTVMVVGSKALMNMAANMPTHNTLTNNTPEKISMLFLQGCLALGGAVGGTLALYGANSTLDTWRAMQEASRNHHRNDTAPLASMDADSSTSLQGVTVERP